MKRDGQKALRREQRRAREEVLTHKNLRNFHREVRDMVLVLVNEHGVVYRIQKDGQHILLYTGDRSERPFKISASRPAFTQTRYIREWAEMHVPDFNE